LCHFAIRYVRDPDTSREIVQESFLNLWQKREGIDLSRDVKSYLTTSIRNKCLNWLRDNKKFNHALLDLEEVAHHTGYEQPDKLVEEEIRRKIESAIGELPERCREVFIQSRFHNKKYQEIADNMNISIKTVETQMSKALQHMRIRLIEYLPVIVFLLAFSRKVLLFLS
jgi:RNA polymerase sigma-70 factor, ECF subfamily